MEKYNIPQDTEIVSEPKLLWGGRWTDEKLDAFEKYVRAYLTIMNKYRHKYNWKLLYFDGFAGSGTRNDDIGEDATLYKLFEDISNLLNFENRQLKDFVINNILKVILLCRYK